MRKSSTLSILVNPLVWLSLALAGCATGPSESRESFIGDATTAGQIGGILLTENLDQAQASKVIVASYVVTANSFDPKEAIVSFGSPGTLSGSGSDYTVELISTGGETLLDYGIWDPRKAVVEQQGIVENPEALFAARFPFRPEAAMVRVRDASGRVVAETEIRTIILEFCQGLKNDPDCSKASLQE